MIINYFWTHGYPYPGLLNHKVTTAYDVNHNEVSITTEYTNLVGKDLSDRYEYVYNSFNQVTSEKYYAMNTSDEWKFSHLFKYYYETYNPGPPYEVNEMDIYPSPTKGDLTLKMLLHDAQPFAVCIYNSVGQKIMQWDEPAIKEYKKTISLPELASGNYFLRVLIGKKRIVKKFVVN